MAKDDGFFSGLGSVLLGARSLSLKGILNRIQGVNTTPKPYKIQFKTEKTHPNTAKQIESLTKGLIDLPFSALDQHGIITKVEKQVLTPLVREDSAPPAPSTREKIAAPQQVDGRELHERLVIETATSIRPVDVPYPNLDCPDLYRKFSVVGVRDGNAHIISTNSLGKTHKTITYGIFDRHGKLRAKGITVREQVKVPSEGGPQYTKIGIIDLEKLLGLNAHTLNTLEDAINKGIVDLREAPVKGPTSVAETPASTLTMLEHIKSLLTQHEEERRVPFERRSGEDRRTKEQRGSSPDRRTGDRRHEEDNNVIQLLDVQQQEEMRSDKERRARYERRSARDRRAEQERRTIAERRSDLHTVVTRSAYVWDKHKLVAHVTDHWSENCKYEADVISTNQRGDYPLIHVLLNKQGSIGFKGEGGHEKRVFVKPDDEESTILRISGKTIVHIDRGAEGTFRLRPVKGTEAEATVIIAHDCLDHLRIEEKTLGKKRIKVEGLTVRVARGWKYLSIEDEKGNPLSITQKTKKPKAAADGTIPTPKL
ncbi:MAG: hypothetical protein EB060_01835 [Proteobacteria bacterium]|nr:hypothetical protein [Pseudomonadota bacterium]